MQPLRPAFDLRIALLTELSFARARAGDTDVANNAARQALITAEQARARALADFQQLEVTPNVTPELARQREALYRELAVHRFQLERRLATLDADDPRLVNLRSEIATLRQEVDRINAQLGMPSAAPHPTSAASSTADLTF